MQDCLASCLFCLSNISILEHFHVLSEVPHYSIYTTEQWCYHNTCNVQVTTCPTSSSVLIIPFQPTPSIIWIAKQFRYQYRCSFCFNQLAPYRQGLCYSKRIITIQGFSTPGWRYRSCSNSFQIWLPYFFMQIMKQPVWIPQLPAEWIKWYLVWIPL